MQRTGERKPQSARLRVEGQILRSPPAFFAFLYKLATTVQRSMKKFLLLCSFVLPLAGCGQKQPAAPVTNQSRFEASGFSVVFPGEPKQKSASQQTPIGAHEIVSYTYRVSSQLALLM